ncbi:unnamed protein product [Rhizophagus irregularis]|nr:unnamed protein product [Rhizophagus irregularis]
MYDIFSEDWFNALKTKVNYHLRADYKKHKTSEAKSIKDWIDKRVKIIRNDQTIWLSNILDKNTYTNIVIDKEKKYTTEHINTILATHLRTHKKVQRGYESYNKKHHPGRVE